MLLIVTRAEARAQGLKRYFTGVPCKHGHLDEAYVKTGRCVTCTRLKMQAYYQANREQIQTRCREYARANIGEYAIRARARQQHLDAALVPLTEHERLQVRAIYKARHRLTQETGILWTVDHHLPLALGGLHHPANLRLLPGHINDSKGAKHPDEFYAAGRSPHDQHLAG